MRAPKKKPTAAKLPSWRASLLRSRAHLLGIIYAPDEKSAEAAAIAEFKISGTCGGALWCWSRTSALKTKPPPPRPPRPPPPPPPSALILKRAPIGSNLAHDERPLLRRVAENRPGRKATTITTVVTDLSSGASSGLIAPGYALDVVAQLRATRSRTHADCALFEIAGDAGPI
jgi:hypothetical protein